MLKTTRITSVRLKNRIDILAAELVALKALQTLLNLEIDIPQLESKLGEAKAKLALLEMIDPKNN